LFAFENGKLYDSENATWLASLPREALAINWLSTVYRCYASAAAADGGGGGRGGCGVNAAASHGCIYHKHNNLINSRMCAFYCRRHVHKNCTIIGRRGK